MRITWCALLLIAGFALMIANHNAAFDRKERGAIVLMACGAVFNSAAVAVMTWPRRVPKKMSRREVEQMAARLDEIK